MMFFYVDESGQTGIRLFDKDQPSLYYGVLSSKVNLDLVAETHVDKMRKKLGVERLHANELGNGRLVEIVRDIESLRKRYDIKFDMYRVVKKDHAMICFFDQVFDQGMNPAVPWTAYWTPLKYVLLLKLAYLFDGELLEKAWDARIAINNEKAEGFLVEVCSSILDRVHLLPDERSREIIGDGLRWAIANPSEIGYNVEDKAARLQVSPNLIGFQSVVHGIASRLKKSKCKASKVVVDRQSEFNSAQEWIADVYDKGRDIPWATGPGLPEMDLKHVPDVPITCTPGHSSAGLELVDIYLWVFKRIKEEKKVAPELFLLLKKQLKKGNYDEVSLEAVSKRWAPWLESLPEPDAKGLAKAREIQEIQEERRRPYIIK